MNEKNKKQPHALSFSFNSAPRCGAKTRRGMSCKSPAVNGKKRCRMHGGAKGSGAPKENQNALKHGRYTQERIENRQCMHSVIREARELILGIIQGNIKFL